ncbi:hypothetical protein GGI12_006115 [Dipsacomyces acuminosporus]|nr:hypothetical protein GGI12_006115 [Dipsacomyces acuminosporus]
MTEQQQQQQQHRLLPSTYIMVHERSPGMPILYVSSSIRQASLYEPHELVGRSPLDFIVNVEDIDDVKQHHETYTYDNIIITNMFFMAKHNIPLYVCAIAFVCSNANFIMASTYPDITIDQYRNGPSIQRFKCVMGEAGNHENSAGSVDFERRSAGTGAPSSTGTSSQACIVLEDLHSTTGSVQSDPKIIFATDSINRILDVDSSDVQGTPFLSLVAADDYRKARGFLDRVLHSQEIVIESLHVVVNPLETDQGASNRIVSVEFMGMGSDDGFIFLCQLERPWVSQRYGSSSGYISLHELISSDPETSDMPEQWGGVGV